MSAPYAIFHKYWTEIINDAVSGVKGTVNLMAADSRNIKEQLKVLKNTEVMKCGKEHVRGGGRGGGVERPSKGVHVAMHLGTLVIRTKYIQ